VAGELAGGAAGTPCACRPVHRGQPFDAAPLNAAAERRLAAARNAHLGQVGQHGHVGQDGHVDRFEVDALIIPGYTPRLGRSRGLHPEAASRCAAAAADLRAGVAPYVIVSGGAVHGPDNEALLLREALLADGVAEDRILVEPCARHTTTNLRNAGRIMLRHGLRDAYVVTHDAPGHAAGDWLRRAATQAGYIGFPRASTFALRCRLSLGYSVGELRWVRPMHIHFVPAPECHRASLLATLVGDP
jgi:hypothetical protein